MVVRGANVLHLVDTTALGAALDGALAGDLLLLSAFHSSPKTFNTYAEPLDAVGVGGEAGTTGKLLVTSRADGDGVLHGTLARGVERAHVENVNALHLSENLETLDTGGLLEIGRHGTRLSTRTVEILLALDLYSTR